jgi:hypothetical protein
METAVGRGDHVGGALAPALRSEESDAHRMVVVNVVIPPMRLEKVPANFEAVEVREMALASKKAGRDPFPRPLPATPAATVSASCCHLARGHWVADLQGIA